MPDCMLPFKSATDFVALQIPLRDNEQVERLTAKLPLLNLSFDHFPLMMMLMTCLSFGDLTTNAPERANSPTLYRLNKHALRKADNGYVNSSSACKISQAGQVEELICTVQYLTFCCRPANYLFIFRLTPTAALLMHLFPVT